MAPTDDSRRRFFMVGPLCSGNQLSLLTIDRDPTGDVFGHGDGFDGAALCLPPSNWGLNPETVYVPTTGFTMKRPSVPTGKVMNPLPDVSAETVPLRGRGATSQDYPPPGAFRSRRLQTAASTQ
jgi:hypothetical protein